jgi:hypothetical protein
MDHTNFPKIFQTLLPIVVFVLWAMFSGANKNKKKAARPRQEHPPVMPGEVGLPPKRHETVKTPETVFESPVAEKLFQPPSSALPIDQKPYATGEHGPVESADYANHSLEELRKFIVWSEILARPLALRDGD